jgi:protein tyrosine/serine phosphatase
VRLAPLALLLVTATACGAAAPETRVAAAEAPTAAAVARPAQWATPIARAGVPNLHQVAPGLYRSAQPTDDGLRALLSLGIHTVVNLRSMHSDRGALGGVPIAYEPIPMVAWKAEEDEMLAFLRVATDPKKQPVLVHCQHGADRTGTAVALYRMVVQGWSREDAIEEMTHGGFGFHSEWSNLVAFLQKVDVERLRTRLAAHD